MKPGGVFVCYDPRYVTPLEMVKKFLRRNDNLFTKENPGETEEGQDFTANLNPNSLEIVQAKLEPSLASAAVGDRFQFERMGYFVVDPDSAPGKPVFNRTVSLKDSWARIAEPKPAVKAEKAKPEPKISAIFPGAGQQGITFEAAAFLVPAPSMKVRF